MYQIDIWFWHGLWRIYNIVMALINFSSRQLEECMDEWTSVKENENVYEHALHGNLSRKLFSYR